MMTNSFPIQWAVESTTADGTNALIPANPTTQDGDTQLIANNLSLLSLLKTPSSISVPGNGNGFNLKVYQFPNSQTSNFLLIELNMVILTSQWAGIGLSNNCYSSIRDEVLAPSATQLVSQSTGLNLLNTIKGYISNPSNWTKIKNIALTCSGITPSALEGSLANLTNSFCNFVTGFSTAELSAVINTGFMAVQIGETVKHWNDPGVIVGICENSNQIINCAAQLAINPSSPTVTIGGQLQLTAVPLDINGNPTLASSAGLTWASSVPTVASIDPNLGVVNGLAVGITTITVQDPSTLLMTNVDLQVQATSQPSLSPCNVVGVQMSTSLIMGTPGSTIPAPPAVINVTTTIYSNTVVISFSSFFEPIVLPLAWQINLQNGYPVAGIALLGTLNGSNVFTYDPAGNPYQFSGDVGWNLENFGSWCIYAMGGNLICWNPGGYLYQWGFTTTPQPVE